MSEELARVAELNAEYEIVRELGRGGTAVVYLARQREPKRMVAIKVIRPTHIGDEESAARLVREAQVVAGMQHPNIVALFATRRLQDGSLALVMQYVAGRTLKSEVQANGAFTLDRAAAVLGDVARALVHAHAKRIVHRDIKPENVFVEETTGVARLSDFGIARAWDADSGLTMPGTALGTPAYMAPEQIDGTPLDGRSDIYSLGVVGWEILTGRRPWAGETLFNIVYKQKHEDLPSLTLLRPGISPRLLRAVEGALRKDPDERWSSAEEFLAVLSGYSVRSRAREQPTPPPAPPVAVDPDRATRPETDRDRAFRQGVDPDQTIQLGADPDRTVRLDAGRAEAKHPEGDDPDRTLRLDAQHAGGRTPPNSADETLALAPPVARSAADATAEQKPVDSAVAETPAAVHVTAEEDEAQLGRGQRFGSVRAAAYAAVLLIALAGIWLGITVKPWAGNSPTSAPPENVIATTSSTADAGTQPLPAVAFPLLGASQQGRAGEPLAEPLILRVEDRQGNPVAGAAVRFEVTAGAGEIEPAETVTDSAGIATGRWTLGSTGDHAAHAVVTEMDGPPVQFHASAVGGRRPAPSARSTPTSRRVARAAAVSAATVEGTAGSAVPAPLMVRATDASGRGISGVRVQFSVRSGDGRITPASAVTGADGTASAEWVLGSATSQEAVARIDGATTPIIFRATARPAPFAVRRDFAAGGVHTCAVRGEGFAYCWGGNEHGQIGDGSTARRLAPVKIATPEPLAALAAGGTHSCAIGVSGAAYCWGNNATGQLGDGTRSPRLKPVRVVSQQRLQHVSVGLSHSCALDTAGRLYCWGQNSRGQLGDNSRTDREVPVRIGARTFRGLALGWRHSCALSAEGSAFCWGSNANGEVGDGSAADRLEPTPVAGGHRFLQLGAGSAHTCGLRTDGMILCWGRNQIGQLGNGSTENSPFPVPVNADGPFSALAVGAEHACALSRQGGARCWGGNSDGQLGDGTTGNRAVPTPVAGDFRFAGLTASSTHTCGVTVSGDGYCWGFNLNGQLGDGTRTSQARPVPVQR